MNVYLFELKRQARGILLQTILLAALLVLLMVVVYPIYSDAEEQVRRVLEGFPPEFQSMFGIDLGSVFSYGGFYSFGGLYVGLIGAITAVNLSVAVFSREKRSQCLDFLLTKPISRTRVFITKLAVCMTGLAVVNVVFVVTAIVVHSLSGDAVLSQEQIVLMAFSLGGTQLVFMALSVLAAMLMKRVRSVSAMATAFGFMGFILAMLPDLVNENLRIISPLQYFDTESVISTGSFEVGYTVLAFGIIIVSFAAAYGLYRFRDIPVR